jgi:hypothetical protein
MGVDMIGSTLGNQQPDHIRRQTKRSVVLEGMMHRSDDGMKGDVRHETPMVPRARCDAWCGQLELRLQGRSQLRAIRLNPSRRFFNLACSRVRRSSARSRSRNRAGSSHTWHFPDPLHLLH